MAKMDSMATVNNDSTEKVSLPPAVDIEEAHHSHTSIHEGELKRTHTFWSCTLHRVLFREFSVVDALSHSVGIPNHDSLHLELQYHSLRYNL